MPVTRTQAEQLASLTASARPHGAPQWDVIGIVRAIERVAQLDLAEVMKACARAAQDRTLRTPAAIGDTKSSAWRERLADPIPTEPRICRSHGIQYRGAFCPSCRADQIGADGPSAPRPPVHARGDVHAVVEELKNIATTTREAEK